MAHGFEVREPLPAFRHSALLRANLVLAPSRDTARNLSEVQGVPPERIRRLAWPLSPDFLRMADAPASLPLPPAFPKGEVVLTVGRWAASERYKGTDDLIRAVAQLRATVADLHLVAVGGGDDLTRLQKLAQDAGIADRVHFLQGCSREELGACYARAKVFALPSTGEGFGLVFLEAMAFSKPVVGVVCGGATDLIDDGINGLLVPPHDVSLLAEALGRLLGDEMLRSKLGRRGAEIVRERYEFDFFQTELENILNECVSHDSTRCSSNHA
jgi:phosphatidylinositol alpha-1,6-mannosyltransferase